MSLAFANESIKFNLMENLRGPFVYPQRQRRGGGGAVYPLPRNVKIFVIGLKVDEEIGLARGYPPTNRTVARYYCRQTQNRQ